MVAEKMLEGSIKPGKAVMVTAKDGKVVIESGDH
jgi:hypothetical protein